MLLKLYSTLTLLAAPLIHLYLQKRKKAGKEDPARFHERLGYPNRERPEGGIIWVHAASVGESLSILPLIHRIAAQFPTLTILLTTGTTTSAALAETRLPSNAFHQYIPVDNILAVRRFLHHWQPKLALWVESELWPNLLTEAKKTCPLILVNARISDRSFATWQKYRSLSHALLDCFSLCLPQSKQDAERLRALGAKHVTFIGNLKYDAPALPADDYEIDTLRAMIGNRPLWVASSTHPGEEAMLAKAHALLKIRHPDVLTIIIPRHARRGHELAAQLAPDAVVALRSDHQPITSGTDIYLADTMGELGIFYRLARIVFIGGSLVNHGGQNPLEAARLHAGIIAGPSMENFRDIIRELEENHGCIRVQDIASLVDTLDSLLRDPDEQARLAEAAFSVAAGKDTILNQYMAAITPFLAGSHAA